MQEGRTRIEWPENKSACLQHPESSSSMHSRRYSTALEYKGDFTYLGSWVESSEKNMPVRKALAWKALNDMTKIWTSDMKPDLKKRFFLSTVESTLLYGCKSWSVTEMQERSFSGTYTKILRKALNIHWSAHITNEKLYGKLPPVCSKIASRRLQLAGH